jgi:hypothetical protein
MSQKLTTALKSITASLKGLADAPAFDRAGVLKTIQTIPGLSDKEANNMVDYAEQQHAAKHGDTDTQALKLALMCLMDSFGADNISTVARNMASERRNAGKLAYTQSQYNAALAGKPEEGSKEVNKAVVDIVNKAKALRLKATSWSDIEDQLNLSGASRQALYLEVKDRKDWDAAKK